MPHFRSVAHLQLQRTKDYETDQKEQDTEAVAGDKGDGGGDYIAAGGPYCAVVHYGG